MPTSKADIIIHPIRMRIITQLFNHQMTAQQLAKALPDIAQATLYRHLSTLESADVIQIVEENPIRGTVEKVYALNSEATRLSPDDIANMTPDEHLQAFTTFAISLIGDFTRFVNAPDDDTFDSTTGLVSYSKVPLNLTDEEAHNLRELVITAMQRASQNPPTENRRRYLVSLISIPDIDESETTS